VHEIMSQVMHTSDDVLAASRCLFSCILTLFSYNHFTGVLMCTQANTYSHN